MKVLQNLFIFGADLSKVEDKILDRLATEGADGFELPGTVSEPRDCQRLGEYFKRNKHKNFTGGLNVAVDVDRDPSSVDPKVRAAGVAYLKSRIDCAVEIGFTTVAGPIVLPWGGFYDTDSTDELHDKFLNPKLKIAVNSMREVADYAKAKGVSLAVEPLHRHEMHGLNTMDETADFVRRVGRKNFGVCLDSSHEVIDGAGPENYARLVTGLHKDGYFIYAQVSAPTRGDLEHSWIPWNDFLGLVKKIGLRSVTIEIMQAVPPFAARNGGGIRLSRRPFRDPYTIVKNAIRTTRQKWGELK